MRERRRRALRRYGRARRFCPGSSAGGRDGCCSTPRWRGSCRYGRERGRRRALSRSCRARARRCSGSSVLRARNGMSAIARPPVFPEATNVGAVSAQLSRLRMWSATTADVDIGHCEPAEASSALRPTATYRSRLRIASAEMLPGVRLLPHLKSSPAAWAGGVRNEAGEHGNEGRTGRGRG